MSVSVSLRPCHSWVSLIYIYIKKKGRFNGYPREHQFLLETRPLKEGKLIYFSVYITLKSVCAVVATWTAVSTLDRIHVIPFFGNAKYFWSY
jgi:hypothetical protein